MQDSYLYIASPYSSPDKLVEERRFLEVSSYVASCLRARCWVYSPIVHCHQLAVTHHMPTDAGFWQEYNQVMLGASRGLGVLMLSGWESSLGIQGEIEAAASLRLPITYHYYLEA